MIWLVQPGVLLGAGLASAVASALFALLVIRGGPVDLPRHRGSHHLPTPTSGGLAIMAATALVTGVTLWLFGQGISGGFRDALILLGFSSLMGLCGALDDIVDLPALGRLGFQIGLCLIFAWFYRVDSLDFMRGHNLTLWWPLGLAGSALWLILVVNAINFMDGSNGLAVGSQAIALSVTALVIMLLAANNVVGGFLGCVLLVCVCAAGAMLGFLPFNLPPAHPSRALTFQGDAGSMFAGAMIGGAILMLKAYAVSSVWLGGFVLAPLLVDVVLTLAVRASKRRNLFKPHKEHLYQVWLQRRDPSHFHLAMRVWALVGLSNAVGLGARFLGDRAGVDIRFITLAGLLTIYSIGWVILRRRLFKRPPLDTDIGP